MHDFCLYGTDYGDGIYAGLTTSPCGGAKAIPFDNLPRATQESYWETATLIVGLCARGGVRGYSEDEVRAMRRNLLNHFFQEEIDADIQDRMP